MKPKVMQRGIFEFLQSSLHFFLFTDNFVGIDQNRLALRVKIDSLSQKLLDCLRYLPENCHFFRATHLNLFIFIALYA